MTLKFFYTYIGIFLASSIFMAVVVKQLSAGFAASGKKPYVYGVVSSVVTSGVAYIATLISNYLFTVYWVLAGVYLLFGIIHMAWVHKKYFYGDKEGAAKALLAEIVFGLSVILFTIVVFFSAAVFRYKGQGFSFLSCIDEHHRFLHSIPVRANI